MHISRHPIRVPGMDEEPQFASGVRPVFVFCILAVVALALTLFLAAHGLGPAAPCLDDPGGVCEPV